MTWHICVYYLWGGQTYYFTTTLPVLAVHSESVYELMTSHRFVWGKFSSCQCYLGILIKFQVSSRDTVLLLSMKTNLRQR